MCDNALNIRRDKLEAAVLSGLREQLMRPDLVKAFCDEFTQEMKRLRLEGGATHAADRAVTAKVERELQSMIEAIKGGMFHASMKAEMDKLETRNAEPIGKLAVADERVTLPHPRLADLYREKVMALSAALGREDTRAEAGALLRGLISAVVLVPQDGSLAIDLHGDLAAMLAMASGQQKPGAPVMAAGRSGSGVS